MASTTLDFPYPPAPAQVPASITRLDSAYRFRSAAMLFSLLLFLIFYLALIAGVAWLMYLIFQIPIETQRGSSRGTVWAFIFKFGGMASLGLLLVFLVKGLFKGQRMPRDQYLQLTEKDSPQLLKFIHQVCADTGAPKPRRIYASADVNASVIFDSSLLNLIIPPRKDLLIGLGLVNSLQLHEFKAVLAHEFGHFAQKSAGMGSYLSLANRVIHDIVYSRDGWDRFVDQWSAIDLRISFPAWGLKGILWVLRKILGGTLKGLNLLHLSLSRQLEFNADNVSVSVCGSDSLIHALSRLEFAQEALNDASQSLHAAADHGHFTDDLFYHQTCAERRLRQLRKQPRLGLPPELPEDSTVQLQVFQEEHDGIPDHLRSHPTHLMREKNAKRIYLRSQIDERSPWILFDNREALCRDMSEVFYTKLLDRKEPYQPEPAVEVQKFLDAEHAETTYDPRYHGYYDGRFINPGDLEEVPDAAWDEEKIHALLVRWLGDEQSKRILQFNERQREMDLLQGLKSGQLSLKKNTFPFREQDKTVRDVPALIEQVDGEITQELKYFHELDREIYLMHRHLARRLDLQEPTASSREEELLHRYRFHNIVQELLKGIHQENARLQSIFHYLQANEKIDQDNFREVLKALQDIKTTLELNMSEASKIIAPEMTNVAAGTSLDQLVTDRDGERLELPPPNSISGEWLAKLAGKLGLFLARIKRVHFKSLGSLLQVQDKWLRQALPMVQLPEVKDETPAAISSTDGQIAV